MSRTHWKTLHRGCAVALMASASAWGQNAPSNSAKDGTELDEVVVTATRSETNLQKTAVAVTAFSAQTLRQLNVTNLIDIGNHVPSLSVGSRSGTGMAGGGVSIRGMGVDATDSQAAVGIYVDDVYFAAGRGNILGLLDLERVEVLRGPQGDLFGRNTIAGAVQYVTQSPSKEFGGYLDGTLGNYGRADAQGAINIPLGETFAVRIAALHTKRDGYIHDDLNNIDRGADESNGVRLRARWTPSDQLTVDLKGEYSEEKTNGRAILVPYANPNAQYAALAGLIAGANLTNYVSSTVSKNNSSFGGFNAPDSFKFDYAEAMAAVTYNVSDALSLKSISAYSTYRSRLTQDLDNSPLQVFNLTTPHDNTGVFSQEFQVHGKALSSRLDYTGGLYLFNYQQRINPNYSVVLGVFPPNASFGNPASDIKSVAAYTRFNYHFTDMVSADLGMRYTHEETKSWLISSAIAPLKFTFTNTSPHVGLNLQLDPDTLLYVKASKGFRAGGFSANADVPGNGAAFNPETAWTYELGARMEFLEHRLRVNPTAFLTRWSNIQFNSLNFNTLDGNPAVTTQNAGDAEIKGFELETEFAVTRNLDLTATLARLDGHYTAVQPLIYSTFPTGWSLLTGGPFPIPVPNSVVIKQNITLDTPLQRLPKVKATLGARYTMPLDNGAKVVASADYSWTDTQMSAVTIADAVVMPSYRLLNARLQYNSAGGRWSVAAFGTNLTDSSYLIGGAGFGHGYTAGAEEWDPARPREFGAEFRFNF